jgi:hypothetical protein
MNLYLTATTVSVGAFVTGVRNSKTFICKPLNGGEHAFHEALTLSPTLSAPHEPHRPRRRGTRVRAVSCFWSRTPLLDQPHLYLWLLAQVAEKRTFRAS